MLPPSFRTPVVSPMSLPWFPFKDAPVLCLGCNYRRGMLLWGSPFVLWGVFSGHMGSMRVMVTGLSGFPSSFCNKEVVTVLKFLYKQLTFYFLKCLSLKALESCAIFEQAPFQPDTSLATGLNILYRWSPPAFPCHSGAAGLCPPRRKENV